MRPGILDQLPTSLSKDDIVFLVGKDDERGIGQLKSLVKELNREGDWIRAEWRAHVTSVPSKATIVLTMAGLVPGTLANVRQSAEKSRGLCIQQAPAVGEAKAGLNPLAQGREKNNGNNGKSSSTPAEVVFEATPPPPVERFEVSESQASSSDDTPTPAPQNPENVAAALDALNNFNSVVEGAQLAVLVIADEVRATTIECDRLREELRVKGEKLAETEELLRKAHFIARQNKALTEENVRLNGEVERHTSTINNLGTLIRGAQTK